MRRREREIHLFDVANYLRREARGPFSFTVPAEGYDVTVSGDGDGDIKMVGEIVHGADDALLGWATKNRV